MTVVVEQAAYDEDSEHKAQKDRLKALSDVAVNQDLNQIKGISINHFSEE